MSQKHRFEFNFIRAVEVFAAVVETRHFTQAAQLLGMTQSAASQHLRNLENSLNTRLINRDVRPIQLTKAGVAFHRRALTILDEVEQVLVDVRRADAAPIPLLRIALLASIATTLAPVLAELCRNRFGIPELSLSAGLSADHHSLLRSKRADLAVTSQTLFDIDGLIRLPVAREQFLLVTPVGYRGDTGRIDTLAEDLPLVRFSRETEVGRVVDQHLSRLRLEIPRAMEGDRSSVVLAPVAAGIGFTLLTPSLLIDGLAEGMTVNIHPLPFTRFGRDIFLVAREKELGELPSVMAQCCRDALTQAVSQRLPEIPGDSFTAVME